MLSEMEAPLKPEDHAPTTVRKEETIDKEDIVDLDMASKPPNSTDTFSKQRRRKSRPKKKVGQPP